MVLQAVISRPSSWEIPRNGKSCFTKKREIEKKLLPAVRAGMLQEQLDILAGDFNGAAWRRRSGGDQRRDGTIEEAFASTNLPIPLAH